MNFHMTFKNGRNSRLYARILLKLKLTLIILTTVILQSSAASFAQITINEKSASLESILQKIRKQSGYDFFYSNNMLKNTKPVSINVKNASVEEVLKLSFKDQPLSYTIEQKAIVLRYNNEPERVVFLQKTITGKILDETNRPIPGASIRVKGMPAAPIAISDGNGNFMISAKDDQILIVSYIGYKTLEVAIVGKKLPLTVKMEVAESQLKEVKIINTGLFKKSEQSFTGATTVVTAKELSEFGNRNLVTSLRNIDPAFNIIESNTFGSNPNRLPEIQIRGNSSIPNVDQLTDETRASLNTPLVILDGFQSTLQKLYDMNENEVESIIILKDAAATSMYGSRGANGVVVVTTKAPKAGKLRFSFRSDLNFEAPDLSDYSLLKAAEKLDLELKAGYYHGDHYNAGERAEFNLQVRKVL